MQLAGPRLELRRFLEGKSMTAEEAMKVIVHAEKPTNTFIGPDEGLLILLSVSY
jgi:hypothetical protein